VPTFSDQDHQRTDYSILQNSPIVLYHRPLTMAADIDALHAEGYRILEVDCSNFGDIPSFAPQLGLILQFWGEWHGGLNAFNDYLSDVRFPDSGCLAVALAHFDALHSNAADFAAGLADIFASSSRYHALFGRRLIMMLQVDECSFHLPPVGACPVIWNRKEFLDKSRT